VHCNRAVISALIDNMHQAIIKSDFYITISHFEGTIPEPNESTSHCNGCIMRLVFTLFFFVLCSLTNTMALDARMQSQDSTSVTLIEVEGTIGPTVLSYVQRGLKEAENESAEMLVIRLDTPGGLLSTTQEIVQLMLASELPIAVYVSPDGANAGSAGTFITLAGHIAAMTPTTTIGAASPVSMQGGEMDTVMQKKIFNYSESFIQSIAEKRGRNAEWAVSAVRDGEAVTAEEALELNVIDFIASDLQELLDQADGMVFNGDTLNTSEATIQKMEESLAEQFFSFILQPQVMLILTLIAIYGIVGEVTNPGAIIPGVAGVIALILLLYGVSAMPINVAGFVLIGLAIILFISEAFTPTFGVLLTGGAVAFFLGALMLFQDLPDDMQLSLYWLIPATILTVLFFGGVAVAGIRAQFTGHRSGLESHIGKTATVVKTVDENGGKVDFAGEYWNAVSDTEIPKGEKCKIISFSGLTCTVKPINT